MCNPIGEVGTRLKEYEARERRRRTLEQKAECERMSRKEYEAYLKRNREYFQPWKAKKCAAYNVKRSEEGQRYRESLKAVKVAKRRQTETKGREEGKENEPFKRQRSHCSKCGKVGHCITTCPVAAKERKEKEERGRAMAARSDDEEDVVIRKRKPKKIVKGKQPIDGTTPLRCIRC
jgi:predicted molibdopterin-dependent oxidoreductase YjgC